MSKKKVSKKTLKEKDSNNGSNVLFGQEQSSTTKNIVKEVVSPKINEPKNSVNSVKQKSKASKIENIVETSLKPNVSKKIVEEKSKTISKQIKFSNIKKKSKKSLPLIAQNKSANSAVIKSTKKDVLIIPREHDSYFVYLKNPLEYRRHLLESSRKILFCLKGCQKITLIRAKKLEEMNKLRTSVKELLYLNKKFNELLPKYNMSVVSHHVDKKQDEIKARNITPAPIARKPSTSKEKTEIEKLEESLANIESKLRDLK